MTEAEWLNAKDPTPMLEFLRGKASDRKFRLFGAACYRRIWHKLPEVSRQVVEVAERFVDGNATPVELRSVRQLAVSHPSWGAEWLAVRNASVYSAGQARHMAAAFISLTPDGMCEWELFDSETNSQAILVRDIFSNPFRLLPSLPLAVLAWNDGTVRRIAEGIYQERRMPEGTLETARLGILADAMLDAGCDIEDMLAHCRQQEGHVRGCWVIDLLLGKE
jgi:hypothetical protein